MRYEKDLNIVLGTIDMITAFTSIPQSEKEELKEGIKEVYAKAEAFDEVMKVFENQFGLEDALAKDKIFIEVKNAYIESEAE